MSARGKSKKNEEFSDEDVPMKTTKQKGGKVSNVSANKKLAAGKKNSKNAKSGSKTSKKSAPARKGKAGDKNDRSAKKKEGDRYFKLVDAKTGRSYGRYTGDTPKQAASKGFTKMLQKLKKAGKKIPANSTIYLRESTRGSARKMYGYEATRQKLPEPQELVITDKETGEEKTITYHYRNKIKKVPVPEQMGGAKNSRSKKSAKNSGKGTSTKKSAKPAAKKPSKQAKPTKKSGKASKQTSKKSQSAKASSSR